MFWKQGQISGEKGWIRPELIDPVDSYVFVAGQ